MNKLICSFFYISKRSYYDSFEKIFSCRLLIVGGGAAGLSLAKAFRKQLKKDDIILLEPNEYHCLKPLLNLVGNGLIKMNDIQRKYTCLIPRGCRWFKDEAVTFKPKDNCICTREGRSISYEYMIVAVGLQSNFSTIPGLIDALEDNLAPVCTLYSKKYIAKSFHFLNKCNRGNVIYICPQAPINGFPLKSAFLADWFFRKEKKRSSVNICCYTGEESIMPYCPEYLEKISEILQTKEIQVCSEYVLSNVDHMDSKASFKCLKSDKTLTINYNYLHVTPHLNPNYFLCSSKELVDDNGFLDVDQYTLRHKIYSNIYGCGDCINVPTLRSLHATSYQTYVVHRNLSMAMEKSLDRLINYDGYTGVIIATSPQTAIFLEFNYSKKPVERYWFDQCKERKILFWYYVVVLPYMYWLRMLRGNLIKPYAAHDFYQIYKKRKHYKDDKVEVRNIIKRIFTWFSEKEKNTKSDGERYTKK